MTRGNQREKDRERAAARNAKGKTKDDGLTPEQRRERLTFFSSNPPALPPSIQASAGGVNVPRHYIRRNASASTSRTLYDESDEDLVDEDDTVDFGNDGEIRNGNLDDYSE
ncbi:small EDRK-rich factor 2-like protein [Tanacetum coccineum]